MLPYPFFNIGLYIDKFNNNQRVVTIYRETPEIEKKHTIGQKSMQLLAISSKYKG